MLSGNILRQWHQKTITDNYFRNKLTENTYKRINLFY